MIRRKTIYKKSEWLERIKGQKNVEEKKNFENIRNFRKIRNDRYCKLNLKI